MHPRLQRQIRVLDAWEREFLAAVRKLLAARVDALEPVVKATLEPGGEKVIEKLGRLRALPGDYLPLLERYVGHVLVEGMVQGRSDVEFLRSRLQRRGVRLAARVDGEPVVPEGAIDFIRHRRDLGRFFEQDQVDAVRTILDNGLQQGASVRQVMDALQTALPGAIGKARAENIARTEATTAFNQGRLEAFRETKGFVAAVEFMAITDARTTPICTERDGLVLAIDDPALPANTPPLHYMCRSVLSPVSEFELEDLGGKAYLARQRDQLEKMPAPLKGFGNEPGLEGGRPPGQPPVVRTPNGPKGTAGSGEARAEPEPVGREASREAPQATTSPDGGVGYDRPLPGPDAVLSRAIEVQGNRIEVRGYWLGHGELARVERGLGAIRGNRLAGLGRLEFVNDKIPVENQPRAFANGICRRSPARIELSRASARNWSDLADEENRRLALRTLWHEVAHHVWFEDFEAKGGLPGLWAKALADDKIDVPGRDRMERFAELFAEYMDNPEAFIASHPETGGFYRDNIAHPDHTTRIEDP